MLGHTHHPNEISTPVVHVAGVHGGPSPRVVALVAAVAFVFGTSVLVAEAVDKEQPMPVRGAMAS